MIGKNLSRVEESFFPFYPRLEQGPSRCDRSNSRRAWQLLPLFSAERTVAHRLQTGCET
jgi:hypothetical protein